MSPRPMSSLVLIILLLSHACPGLTLDEVSRRLASQDKFENFDMTFTTVVKAGGISISTQAHQIAKGKEKLWLELQSAMGSQRIIKNGNKVLAIDLGTGKRKAMNENAVFPGGTAPENLTPPNLAQEYSPPILVGKNLYAMEKSTQPDSMVKYRKVIFNASLNRITEITEVTHGGDTTLTRVTYCLPCEFRVPKSIRVSIVSAKKERTEMTLDYTHITFPASIPDNLFKVD